MSTRIPVDDFTRANETPLAGNYSAITGIGALNLASNAIAATTIGTSCGMYYNAFTPGNDQWAQVDVPTFVTSDTALHPGPMVRVDTAVRTYYVGQVGGTANNGATLERRVAGVKTTVETQNTTVNTAPMTVYLSLIGQAYDLKVNGVSLLTPGAVDAGGITGGGRLGLFAYAQDVLADLAVDNFVGGDFVTELPLPLSAIQAMKRGAYF